MHRPYLELKLTYVGSAEDETYAQLHESALVGPINIGADEWKAKAIPFDELIRLNVVTEELFRQIPLKWMTDVLKKGGDMKKPTVWMAKNFNS
ncbi:histone chaperone ASF1B-like protein [Tanacetum coccineum]